MFMERSTRKNNIKKKKSQEVPFFFVYVMLHRGGKRLDDFNISVAEQQ